jgi:hypothetical protein
MGEHGQINGSARHDYQADVACLARDCGTQDDLAWPDYPSSPFGHLYPLRVVGTYNH